VYYLFKNVFRNLTDDKFNFHSIKPLGGAKFEINVITEGNKQILPIQKASQGTLSILSMFGLIYYYLRELYPDIEHEDVAFKDAIICIDEIDAHLHPSWQQKIINLLRNSFPNVQFFITAHSPLVVAGCYEKEINVLRKEEEGYKLKSINKNFIGAKVTDLYSNLFEIDDYDETYLYYRMLGKIATEQNSKEQRYIDQVKNLKEKSNMKRYERELILLYAQKSLDKIQSHKHYQEILLTHSSNSKLAKLDKQLENIKKELTEIYNQNLDDSRVQVSNFLQYFYDNKDMESSSLEFRKLMLQQSYYQEWSQALQEYYDEKLQIVLDYEHHYFISFSRSSTNKELPNRINRDYVDYIKKVLTDTMFENEQISENLLAKAIHHHLEDKLPMHDGYIDYKNTEDKYDIHIQKACENSIYFIQIIQNIMLSKKHNSQKENYCYKEFEFVQKGIKSKIKYIVAEGNGGKLSNDKNLVFTKFMNWYDDIQSTSCIFLDDTKVNIIEGKVNRLAVEIENYISSIFDDVKRLKY